MREGGVRVSSLSLWAVWLSLLLPAVVSNVGGARLVESRPKTSLKSIVLPAQRIKQHGTHSGILPMSTRSSGYSAKATTDDLESLSDRLSADLRRNIRQLVRACGPVIITVRSVCAYMLSILCMRMPYNTVVWRLSFRAILVTLTSVHELLSRLSIYFAEEYGV